jgi:hypothetical protein
MSNRSKNSSRPRHASRRRTPSASEIMMVSRLDDLVESSKTQSVKFAPEQKDVPRLRFKQATLFNVELSYLTSFSTSTTVPTFGGLVFQLSNSSNASAYTAIFDRYRILQVNVKFMPNIGPTGAAPLYTVLDYDDANAPTAIASLLAFGTLKITPNAAIDERTLTPRLATAAYSGSFASYANLSSKTWIDSASPGVDYFGIKYGVPITATSYSTTVIVTLMVQFKSQRAS